MAHHVALYIHKSNSVSLPAPGTLIETVSVDCGRSIHHSKQCRNLRDRLLRQENFREVTPGILVCKPDLTKWFKGSHFTIPFYYDTLEEPGYRLVSSFSNTDLDKRTFYTLIYRGEEK